MTPNGIDSIIDKIKKLLSLAANNPSAEEAASAAAKCQALMDEYQITQQDVDSRAGAGPQPVGEEDLAGDIGRYSLQLWKRALVAGIARLNHCSCYQTDRATRIRLIGRQADRQIVDYLSCYLMREIEALAIESYKAGAAVREWTGRSCSSRVYVQSFGMAATSEVLARMKAERQAAESSGITALVVRREAEIQAYMAVAKLRLRTMTSTYRSDGGAYHNGAAAGRSIQWRSGVENRAARQIGGRP